MQLIPERLIYYTFIGFLMFGLAGFIIILLNLFLFSRLLSRLNCWYQCWENAFRQYKIRIERGRKIAIIEVACQHPLNPNGTPNQSFKRRLDRAIKLYHQIKSEGWQVYISANGSRHREGSIIDPISLSESAKIYLLKNDISEIDIVPETIIGKYHGKRGSYNGCDESHLVAQFYREKGGDSEYPPARLIVVCDLWQMLRKFINYIWWQLLPEFSIADLDEYNHYQFDPKAYHKPINQLVIFLYTFLFDPDWQGRFSYFGRKSRRDRVVKTN